MGTINATHLNNYQKFDPITKKAPTVVVPVVTTALRGLKGNKSVETTVESESDLTPVANDSISGEP